MLEKVKNNLNKISLYKAVRLGYIFTMAIICFTLGIMIIFLYRNYYQTIAQTKEIQLLRQKVPIEVLNINLYKKITTDFENKTNASSTIITSDPFAPLKLPAKK